MTQEEFLDKLAEVGKKATDISIHPDGGIRLTYLGHEHCPITAVYHYTEGLRFRQDKALEAGCNLGLAPETVLRILDAADDDGAAHTRILLLTALGI